MLGGHASDPPPYRRPPRHLQRTIRRPLSPIVFESLEDDQDEETLRTFRKVRTPDPALAR